MHIDFKDMMHHENDEMQKNTHRWKIEMCILFGILCLLIFIINRVIYLYNALTFSNDSFVEKVCFSFFVSFGRNTAFFKSNNSCSCLQINSYQNNKMTIFMETWNILSKKYCFGNVALLITRRPLKWDKQTNC